MLKKFIVFVLILALPTASPLSVLQSDHPPLAAELSARAAARASRLMQDASADPRLSLPGIQDLAAIKKVAETLIMLGQEVIPSIIGEMPTDLNLPSSIRPVTEIPNDTVDSK